MEQLNAELEKLQQKKDKQKEWSEFVEKLQHRKKIKEITDEEYRKLVDEWVEKNRW